MRLTDLVDALENDQSIMKLASRGQEKQAMEGEVLSTTSSATTEEPAVAMHGGTAEDKQTVIRNQLTEMAGAQQEGASAAKEHETLNTDNKPADGATELIPPAAPPQEAMEAMEGPTPTDMAGAVAGAVGDMGDMEQQKAAAAAIIEKLGYYFEEELAEELAKEAAGEELTEEQVEELEKAAEEQILKVAEEFDAMGRIAAHGFWDELQKLSSETEEG
jgi:hypothetical protein